MRQPARIAVKERAQIVHAVFEHRDPVDPEAEGKALPFVRVQIDHLDHPGVDHSAAAELHPIVAIIIAMSTDDAATTFVRIPNINLDTRLGEGEVGRAQAQGNILALEECFEEGLERPFEVAEVNVAIDRQTFNLMEHRRVRGVAVRTIDPAWRDDADRRALRLHRADLNR